MAEACDAHRQRLALALEPGGDDLACHDGGVSRHKVPRRAALDVAQRVAQERQAARSWTLERASLPKGLQRVIGAQDAATR
jgi:hypothetical protein